MQWPGPPSCLLKNKVTMPQLAHFLFENARVFTADHVRPSADAVAVRDNRIVFVGSRAEAQSLKGAQTRVIDAGGGTLMPGFIDSHFHMMYGALNLDGMQLEPATNYEELSKIVLTYAAQHPDDAWLPGTGLRYNAGPGHTPLNRHHLDALVADRPIYINAFDGHTSWANTLALKMAGIFNGGVTGPNSENVLDEHGESTGELREPGAYQVVSDMVPKPDAVRQRTLLQQALKLTASLGVTSVHNMDGNEQKAAIYAALDDLEQLTCRIYIPYSVSPETPLEALEKEALPLKQNYEGEMLRAGSVKFFIDGVIEGYTGLLVDPYADNPSTSGAANYDIDHYQRMVTEADRLGLQIFTHSVGDMGVRRVLDAYQNAQRLNGKRDSRHRIEHIELVHPDDLLRFIELGVLASMQPLHSPMQVDENDIWPVRVGRERWPLSFAWQTLREASATLVFGSDWPVVTQNPLRGISNAVTRKPWAEDMPSQSQTLEESLIAYTRDAAYAEFQERHKGQIKEGYLADLVLLPKNLFEIPPEEIAELKPSLTMADGRVVYEA
jgi:predicted amidohydrolase YtcJ